MKETEITKFLVSFSGQIEFVTFPAGVFDDRLYINYDIVWGLDWDPISGLSSGTTQRARCGSDPERVVFNMPFEMVLSSTNISGWPQLILTVRAQNLISGDSLRGYALILLPPTTGNRVISAPLFRPRAATMLGEWLAWLTGRHPELADVRMLADGKDNYLLRTESYGMVTVNMTMVSKDMRKLGYDNQPPIFFGGNWSTSFFIKMRYILLLLVSAAVTFADELPPSCERPIYCNSSLLHYVQMARIFPDSKTYVDLQMRKDENTTLEDFNNLLKETNNNPSKEQLQKFVADYFDDMSELEAWTPSDHSDNPKFLNSITDDNLKQFGKDINAIWPTLARKVKPIVLEKPRQYSFIPVSHGFIVPGGRFKEIYYWDTYWIIEGLLISGMTTTARGMIENLIELLNKIGHIPNGSRWYYQERSQPPLLSAMIYRYYENTNDDKFLKENVEALEKEIYYWLDTHVVSFEKDEKLYTLLRYYSLSAGPRPESYFEDYENAQKFDNQNDHTDFYINIKSAAESGWDFSSRWFISSDGDNNGNLTNIRTTSIIPVDLNSIFANALDNLAYFYRILKNPRRSARWAAIAEQWKSAINGVLWNDEDGIWYDYDILNMKHRNYFYPSNVAPLWLNAVDKRIVVKHAPKVLKYLKNSQGLDFPGGIPASLVRSGEQWDFPNVWPPEVSIVINALENMKLPEASNLAKHLAQIWLRVCYKGFSENKQMFEKYDAEEPGKFGGGGEYTVQIGFGWSNGVVIEFLKKYGDKVTAYDNIDVSLTSADGDEAEKSEEIQK
ncbi:hypothetical protein K1T71_006998 [Dendrolimus kikuchii]|uniref:Uncharacterized protein n=1 Tax=Dendrolimus kikuchii TaxID=765133 RepID=A0ACC1CZ64_9NEOP|nr:hypothetical protein K1T71_006998 [Dendrolimus kikuchii]